MRTMNQSSSARFTVNTAAMLLASLIIVVCVPCVPAVASDQEATPSNDSRASQKCGGITDARDWPNPYIIVNTKDVVVIVHGSSVPRHEMPLNQLAAYLKQLPKNAWPCGKVVAAQQNGLRGGPNDGPAIDENCSKVNKILKDLEVRVDWWPM